MNHEVHELNMRSARAIKEIIADTSNMLFTNRYELPYVESGSRAR